MTFTVVWKPRAEQRLAELWLDGPDRGAMTAAANMIDAILRTDPQSAGESRSGQTRILIVPPLVVLYEVREQDRLVSVLKVWRLNIDPEGEPGE